MKSTPVHKTLMLELLDLNLSIYNFNFALVVRFAYFVLIRWVGVEDVESFYLQLQYGMHYF